MLITKRNGHGQTECVGCKNKGKFALKWDCFLYTFNDEPYCLECLLEMLENLYEENQELKKQYEKVLNDYCHLDAYNKTQIEEYKKLKNKLLVYNADIKYNSKKFIKWLEDEIKDTKIKWGNKLTDKGYLDIAMTVNAYEEILRKYKEIMGVENDRD